MEATFEQKRAEVSQRLEDFFKVYDEFTMDVCPSQWRIVGHHVTDMRSMYKEVNEFKEMTDEQKNDPKIKIMLEEKLEITD